MNPADFTLNISPSSLTTNRPLTITTSVSTLKNGRVPVPRVDLEPIYTQLKSALGHHWPDYKVAMNGFILGNLNQAELSWVLQPLLSPAAPVAANATSAAPQSASPSTSSTLYLHNSLLAAIYANCLRDPPPADIAPWVVATDKPSTSAKNAGASGANDKAEERLKKEVMNIHARDRRRVKALKEPGRLVNDGLDSMQAYKHELAVKTPDVSSSTSQANASSAAAATGSSGTGTTTAAITKTNWDLEIRRRYAQPLAAETLEFPAQSDLANRIEPICCEEGIVGGVAGSSGGAAACAELIESAAEVFLKAVLGEWCARTRANGDFGGVQTRAHKSMVRREEADAERGVVQRNAAGFLPVEIEAQAKRQPLAMDDLRLALDLGDGYLVRGEKGFLSAEVALGRWPDLSLAAGSTDAPNGTAASALQQQQQQQKVNGSLAKHEREKVEGEEGNAVADGIAMEVDEADWGWRGGAKVETDHLMATLDECLAAVG